MRIVKLALAGLLALATPVLADTPPLPPGKPAGVQQSISKSGEAIYLGLAAVVAGGAALLVLGKSHGGVNLSDLAVSTTTTTTSP
jgi:hypothetical protein